jgi:carbonic anhydrase/acetyltransferase-like protein (isoleucine patch superfamily)
MPILPFHGTWPQVSPDAFVAESAYVIGDVTIGSGSTIWYGAVVRGDMAPIIIGARSNVQDGSVIHVDEGVHTVIGDDVVIGHGAIVHGAIIGDGAMIAMRATVMNRATVGREAIIGAGAVVTQGKEIPTRGMAVGVPAKVARDVTDDEAAAVRANAARYVRYGASYRAEHARANGEGCLGTTAKGPV